MHTLQTGENFEANDYTVTRIGAGSEEAMNDWALFCVAYGTCPTCEAGTCPAKDNAEAVCECRKHHVHMWVKAGHCFSAGSDTYMLEASTRESSTIVPTDANSAGLGDC